MSLQFCMRRGADQREARSCARSWAPFPSLSRCVFLREGGKLSRAACRRSVPLTAFLPSVQSKPRERGPGVSGGLSPWRSMRQRLMRALSAPSSRPYPNLSLLRCPFRRNRFSARFSCAPVSPRFHPHSIVAVATVPIGVLDTRGAAISESICGVPVTWFPTISHDLAVTPTRRFRISRRFRSLSNSKSRLPLSLYAATFAFPLALAAATSAALRL